MIDTKILWQSIPQIATGMVTTLELMICALIIGLLLALILTMCSYLNLKIINIILKAYTFIIRGTPLLVQIFIIYYGSSQFDFIRNGILWNILKEPFACAVIALALNTSAYSFELFRGAISAIPYGEIEACQALGLSKLQMLRKVIAPRAIRLVLPAYSNEVIIILKSTTLASTITLMDIMGVIHAFISQTYLTASYLLLAGSIYLFLNLIIINIFRYIEGRLSYQ